MVHAVVTVRRATRGEGEMAKPSVDELLAVESRLNRSLVACVLAVLASFIWTFQG